MATLSRRGEVEAGAGRRRGRGSGGIIGVALADGVDRQSTDAAVDANPSDRNAKSPSEQEPFDIGGCHRYNAIPVLGVDVMRKMKAAGFTKS